MDTLAGAEERKLRAARRFGRIGLALTLVWLLGMPGVVVFIEGLRPATEWPLYLCYLAAIALHLWRVREHMRSLGRRAPLWFVVASVVVGLAVALIGLATGPFGAIWSVVAAVLLGDVVAGLGAFYILSIWVVDVERLWWLKAVTDMDDARRAAAELATARERLRLADDLHDILGHALEVVAFKSELAARLQGVDADRARREMEEVQRVARDSLSEVRSLVRETRGTDLVAELAGARAVLASAGIALVVRGDPGGVGPVARNVLGRVLREAMTNVLRHAQPSHCTIEIELVDGDARLRVVNDGALPSDGAAVGTGLVALERYLEEHAGHLDAGHTPEGTFRLDAVLPEGAR